MINQPTEGVDPIGRAISRATPDRPGVFLSHEAALTHLRELPDGDRYRVVERGVRASRWNMSIWVAVPKRWKGLP